MSKAASPCGKRMHRHRDHAQAAARQVLARERNLGRVRVYRCHRCRFADGQRAWHWANAR